jgi:hypothetical protein
MRYEELNPVLDDSPYAWPTHTEQVSVEPTDPIDYAGSVEIYREPPYDSNDINEINEIRLNLDALRALVPDEGGLTPQGIEQTNQHIERIDELVTQLEARLYEDWT